jgi:hypothetical protein
MRLFGRRKPLHERLLEEGGLEAPSAPPAAATGAREPQANVQHDVHGLARERQWDMLATVEAAELAGNEIAFDVLPDRTVLVAAQDGDESLTGLADAIERELKPPYRARAVRQSTELWAVAARGIQVVRLPDREGEELELTVRGDDRRLTVDGAREFGGVPELETLGEAQHRDYVVRAERLDDDWWEVRVDPL